MERASWSGSVSGFAAQPQQQAVHGDLHWLTLKFHNPSVEATFVRTRRFELVRSVRACSGICSLGVIAELLASQAWDYDHDRYGTKEQMRTDQLSHLMLACLGGISAAAAFMMSYLACLIRGEAPAVVEAASTMIICLSLVLMTLSTPVYVGSLLGYDTDEHLGAGQHSDIKLVMELNAVIAGTALLIPIRFHLMLLVQFTSLLCYMLAVAIFGSHHPDNISRSAVFLSVVISVTIAGKRRAEMEERAYFLCPGDKVKKRSSPRQPKCDELDELKCELRTALDDGDMERIEHCKSLLKKRLNFTSEQLCDMVCDIRRQQSLESGVTFEYLLSSEFQRLAVDTSGKEDPTFNELREVFFLGDNAIGRDQICPRDGLPGCALVDTLQPCHHRQCTHYLSWTWRYHLSLVRECLQRWADKNAFDNHSNVSFFMCFFVNNQYRIFAPTAVPNCLRARGSDRLEATLGGSLIRIGKMVALLDHYKSPVYLTRIWTIFEQFKAHELNIPVQMVMPAAACDEMVKDFMQGESGINKIMEAVEDVNSFCASASDEKDEEKVKMMIDKSVGFTSVDRAITNIMIAWVSNELQAHLNKVMQVKDDELMRTFTPASGPARRTSMQFWGFRGSDW